MSTKPKQLRRATRLRGLIERMASGVRPAGTAKTPRELTDQAARRKWEAERKKKP